MKASRDVTKRTSKIQYFKTGYFNLNGHYNTQHHPYRINTKNQKVLPQSHHSKPVRSFSKRYIQYQDDHTGNFHSSEKMSLRNLYGFYNEKARSKSSISYPETSSFVDQFGLSGSLGFRSDSINQPTIYQTPHYSPNYNPGSNPVGSRPMGRPPHQRSTLRWISEPPGQLMFANSTGGRVGCAVEGVDESTEVKWMYEDGRPFVEVIPNSSYLYDSVY